MPKVDAAVSLKGIRTFLKDRVANNKLPDELCVMPDFPRMPGGVKVKKFGSGGVQEQALNDGNREKIR